MRKGKKVAKRLEARRRAFAAMVRQQRIGDGHRGPEGYKQPGSNKK